MKKFTLLIATFLLFWANGHAQNNCMNWSEYVSSKNTGTEDFYNLKIGSLEKAAQTYFYSGQGNLTDIRIDGKITDGSQSATIKVSVYNVDTDGKPTTLVSSKAQKTITWYNWETYRIVRFGSGGIPVHQSFAVGIMLVPGFSGQEFELQYTGDGEGNGEDLPSVGGTSTGGNWTSLLPDHDGDFYIIPRLNHFITTDFAPSASCNVVVNDPVDFTNLSKLTTDSMFNTINLSTYSGTKTLYEWDFGDQTSATIKNPSHRFSTPGVYTVSLTAYIDNWPMGGTSCSHTKTMKISVGEKASGTPTNLGCNADNSGKIKLTASGGDNSKYMYSLDQILWQNESTFDELAAGTYPIYVRDGLGCIVQGTSVNVTEPSAIAITTPISTTPATCGKSDGSLSISASGGVGTLEYSLDNSKYQTSGTFTDLAAGLYTVYVKDENDCVQSVGTTLGNSTGPSLKLSSYTTVACKGDEDGTITVIGSGGTGALEYSLNGTTFQSAGKFTGISPGMYYPVVKDAAGCIGTLSGHVVISEPAPIMIDLVGSAVSCNGAKNGIIEVKRTRGGTGTLTYSLDGNNYQSGTTFTRQAAGLYTVTAKDAAGCITSGQITLTEPNAITVSTSSSDNLTCNASNDGKLTIKATGGSGDYLFSLDGLNYYPSNIFYNLEAKNYTLTVKDKNGCSATASKSLTQPNGISANVTTGNSTCGDDNGTMLVAASGGSGSVYTYNLMGSGLSNANGSFKSLTDGNYLVLVEDGDNCEAVFSAIITDSDGPTIVSHTSTSVTCYGGDDGSIAITSVTGGTGTIQYSVDGGLFQTSNQFTGLEAGSHTVVVKDANGCTGEISVTITEPSAISINLSKKNATCYGENDGSITVSAGGGAGTLAYSIDGKSFQSSPTFNNLYAGPYIVIVKDAGQCATMAPIMVSEPSEIKFAVGILDVQCNGNNDGALYVRASGGVGAITFSIDGNQYQSFGKFQDLAKGLYTVYVKDAEGCEVTSHVEISEPLPLQMSSNIQPVSCAGGNNGVIDISVTGGINPYTFSWSNLRITEDIFNLMAGDYSVVVTDANGCTVDENFTLTAPTNPLIVNGTVTDASNSTAEDGEVDVTVTGGIAPYTFTWNNGEETEDISSLKPGVYSVTVVDANNCSHTTSFTVSFTIGIDRPEEEENLKIYPNPAREMFTLELEEGTQIERVRIYNTVGRVLYDVSPYQAWIQIDVMNFKSGMYYVHVNVNNQTIMRKIMINR